MREENINKMNFKELRAEVQMLRDELAIFKRKYEDILYNLDNDNFSSRIIKEKDGMKAEIELTAERLVIAYSKIDTVGTELSTRIEQNAEQISLVAEQTDSSLEQFSAKLELAAQQLETKVSETDVEGMLVGYSTIQQTAKAIETAVAPYSYSVITTNENVIALAAQGKLQDGFVYYNPDTKLYYKYQNGQLSTFSDIPGAYFRQTDSAFYLEAEDVYVGKAASNSNKLHLVNGITLEVYPVNSYVDNGSVNIVTSGGDIYLDGKAIATQEWATDNCGTGGTSVVVFG